jgi:hypothetical protein
MNVIHSQNVNHIIIVLARLCCRLHCVVSETLWNEILEDSKDSRSIGTVDDGQTEHRGDASSLPYSTYYRLDCKQAAQVA